MSNDMQVLMGNRVGRKVLPFMEGACCVNCRGSGGLSVYPRVRLTQLRARSSPEGPGRRMSQAWNKDRGVPEQAGLGSWLRVAVRGWL